MKFSTISETLVRLKGVMTTLLDLGVAGTAFLFAYATAYGFDRMLHIPGIVDKTGAFTAISGICFVLFSVNRTSWRYVSIPDLITITKAATAAVVIYTLGSFLLTRSENVPRSVPVLTTIFLLFGLAGTRIAVRLILERSFSFSPSSGPRSPGSRNVLLCGLSAKAESFIRSVRRDPKNPINIIGILDEAEKNRLRMIQGVKTVGKLTELERVISDCARNGIVISELIVTENSPSRQRLAEIVETATSLKLKVLRIPDITDTALITPKFLDEPKPIELGDLLERPEVKADYEGVARLIDGKVILATGAGGSIGSELCRQIATFNPRQLIITDSSEFHIYMLDKELREQHPQLPMVTRIVDVRDANRVARIFSEFKPEVVFHAAALKHVPLVEENPIEGIKTNVLGTRNVANAALANEAVTFIMISTDKAVNPTNIMGATKRAAEAYCQSLDVNSTKTRFKTVRFGNVLGSNGSVVPRFQEQIAAGGPVTVTHPHIVRFFMTIPEAVRLVLHASAHALRRQTERGKIMVLDMGKPVRIVDLAERMIQLAGYKPRIDVEIVFTGLRPGEKLFEELFDPSEIKDSKTEEGFVIAAPRIIDKALLHRTLTGLDSAVEREDLTRAVELLAHIVPEYRKDNTAVAPFAEVDETERPS
ncbi:O-antigen biosynthesis protein WbqV [Mesorhizobium albiziae]|uniref:O-antigen biosynthesis protein WbqV n=1 Tax=Neomesorhizobium albiziae TaxID=335020 RepID=A0A1I4F8E4_9HYPH|nr:nucleoside-diphosphate sugar epimerase/dehydratase [Mesorhizobium albiziae]SFL14228.1 O-antigen biosynthesis protein WbqV [Mesorhizobium albiziae]